MNKTRYHKVIQLLNDNLLKLFIFIISTALALISSRFVGSIIKPSNPYDILNLYTSSGFSPEQNYLKIIWIIFFSILFYIVLNSILTKKPKIFRLFFIVIVPFIFLTINFMPQIESYKNNLDGFHNGEQLSPANDLLKGKSAFSDIFVLHGAGEDILVPAISINIGGNDNHAIGTYYFITTLLKLVSAALLILLISSLFSNTILFITVSLWMTFSVYSSFFYVRDIFTWIICLLIAKILIDKKWLTDKKSRLSFIGLGALASLSTLYTVDRGVIACILVGMLGIATVFIGRTINDKMFTIKLPRKLYDFKLFIYIIIGGLAVQIIAAITLGIKSYAAFISSIMIDIPRYQGLLFNFPLPSISKESLLLWIPVIIAPIIIMMIINMFINDKKTYGTIDSRLVYSIILVIGSIVFLRIGYGRSDWGHIAYSTPLMFITLFYTIYLYVIKINKSSKEYWLPILAIFILFIPVSTIDINRISAFASARPSQLKSFVNLLSSNDEVWVNENMEKVVSYIKQNTTETDPIFVFTQQPIYYYLTNRINPTRFYIPWFADPAPLENELLQSLVNNPPKIIIYSNNTNWDTIDGYSMSQRTPKVDSWIKDNYRQKTVIKDILLLSR